MIYVLVCGVFPVVLPISLNMESYKYRTPCPDPCIPSYSSRILQPGAVPLSHCVTNGLFRAYCCNPLPRQTTHTKDVDQLGTLFRLIIKQKSICGITWRARHCVLQRVASEPQCHLQSTYGVFRTCINKDQTRS